MMNNCNSESHQTRRIAILQHGGLRGINGKTGLSLLRYRPAEIVAVIDNQTAGKSLRKVTKIPLTREIPIVATLRESLQFTPDTIVIGIAPVGGTLPDQWLLELREAVRAGISIWNGLHFPLAADVEISRALSSNVRVWDMRTEPQNVTCGKGKAQMLTCKRVLFVGTDMAIGKMTAALELDRAAKSRGLRSKFVATGQTGMMIAGDGICLDAVRVDFATGAVESEIMRHGPFNDVLWIEGQGSMLNPASTATLPLIRGSQPTQLILVHKARMVHLQQFPHVRIPPLDKVVEFYEHVAAAGGAFPSVRVVGVALNTWGLSNDAALVEVARIKKMTGLPCVDVVRHGCDPLLDAVCNISNA